MSDLKVTTLQSNIFWENEAKNINHFSELISKVDNSDLIILPEMFTTGFTMNTDHNFTTKNGNPVKWLSQLAKEKNAVIIGSLIFKEQEKYFNRLVVSFPTTKQLFYDKRHLFRMANEHEHFSPGSKKLVFNYKGWNICPLICYDLRFPVWSRNQNNEIDLYIYVANWPEARVNAWTKLLQARAIENLSYVIGVNRIGEDGKGIQYNGKSAIINFIGDSIFEHPENEESIQTTSIDLEKLNQFRSKFAAHLDADNFKLIK